ncbi:MAG: ABC transporter substrate-binding protein, partial [Burkholderiales bacterium]
MKRFVLLALSIFITSAFAADKIKVGFISTLSGPNAAIGIDIRDAFNLAIKLNGGRLGGLPAEVLVSDDQLKPENAKQIAERYLRLEKVDFITGPVFSNVVVAIAPDVLAAKTFFVAPNAGPALYSGAQCNPFFFVSSWPSEAYSEAAGQHVTSKGIKNVLFLAPNYVGGHDAANGFKRYYKGKLVDEMYTKL